MVETAATFPTSLISNEHNRSYDEIVNEQDVRAARSLSEQDSLIMRHLGLIRDHETVVFDASKDRSSFEAYQQKGFRVIQKLRERRERRRKIENSKRMAALQRIDAAGYSFRMLVIPPKP